MNKRIIVSLSGGKDSTAMLLRGLELGLPVDHAVFFDTGWEFPQMLDHIDLLERRTGVRIVRLRPSVPFCYQAFEHPVKLSRAPLAKMSHEELQDKFVMMRNRGWIAGEIPATRKDLIDAMAGKIHRIGYGWPSVFRRWCTRTKVEVGINRYFRGLEQNFICWVGFAADEKHRMERPTIHQSGYEKSFPLVEWNMTEADALKYCRDRDYDWSGLYDVFDRVSCFCCPLQRLSELKKLRQYFPELWQKMLAWEASYEERCPRMNRGFRDYDTVHDLEKRFAEEEKHHE